MPSLEWIGKEKVIAHHQDVPVHELVHQYGFTVDGKQDAPTDSNNMIIHGDNLIALVVAWFVPSYTILEQTLEKLRDVNHPYRQKLDSLFNGRVVIVDKE